MEYNVMYLFKFFNWIIFLFKVKEVLELYECLQLQLLLTTCLAVYQIDKPCPCESVVDLWLECIDT